MTRHYRNEYLFSEIYLKEITEVEETPEVAATFSALKAYREYADTSTLPAWNQSFVHEVLKALEFDVKPGSGNLAMLHRIGDRAPLSLCFSVLPSEDLDHTRMGRNWSG